MEEILKYKKINSDILPNLRDFVNMLNYKIELKKESEKKDYFKTTGKEGLSSLLNKVCEKNLDETVYELKKINTENLFEEIEKRLSKPTILIFAKLAIKFYNKSELLNLTQKHFTNFCSSEVKKDETVLFLKSLHELKILSNKLLEYCAEKLLKINIDLFLLLISDFFVKINKSQEQLNLEKKISELNLSLRHKLIIKNLTTF